MIDYPTSRFVYFNIPISHGIYSLHPVSDCTLTIGISRILTHRKPRKVLKTRVPHLVQILSQRALKRVFQDEPRIQLVREDFPRKRIGCRSNRSRISTAR